MQLPLTIDGVILRLEDIIKEAMATGSPMGLFAALYQKVTIAVKQGIAAKRFENGDRMERLDVVFANRYLTAYDNFRTGKTSPASWVLAFEATRQKRIILLQHLFLSINAHINMDLGLATAEIMRDQPLENIKADFEMINTVLSELMREVQTGIGMVSPLLFLADVASDDQDERFASFSLKAARTFAWEVARRFHQLPASQYASELETLDQTVASLAGLMQPRGWLRKFLVEMVYFFESKNVEQAIGNLYGSPQASRILK